MSPDSETFSVFEMNGRGDSRILGRDVLLHSYKLPENGFLWANIRRFQKTSPSIQNYPFFPMDEFVRETLLAQESRPRCSLHGDGVILNLRAVNFNPGEEPEDMVSVAIWAERDRVITISEDNIQALKQIEAHIAQGHAPKNPADLITDIAFRLTGNMEPVIAELSDSLDDLEEEHEDLSIGAARARLTDIRRTAILFRRFIAPQREAINHLTIEDIDWIDEHHEARLREATDRVTRYTEELDALRERAAILHDQLTDRRAEQMNEHMLILTIAAAVFLPLSYIAGLMGMNVGGLPGLHSPYGFWSVCGLSAGLAIVLLWLFRTRHWF